MTYDAKIRVIPWEKGQSVESVIGVIGKSNLLFALHHNSILFGARMKNC